MNENSSDHAPLLVRLGQLLGSSLEIQEVLETLIDEILSHTGAERGFIVVRASDSREEGWLFRTARAIDPENLDLEEFRVSRGIIEEVSRSGKSVLTDDATSDSRFNRQASVRRFNLRAILCVPLTRAQRVLGVIYVDNKLTSGAFTKQTQQLVESIAGPAAVAVDNALLYDQLRRVYEKSLDQARRELADTQAQLHQASKMSAVGQLAAGVAHEVNNPLGAIQLNLSSLRDYSQEAPYLKRIDLCLNALERCRKVVHRLLTFAHPGERPAEVTELDACLNKSLDLIQSDLNQHDIKLVRQFQPNLWVKVIEDELCQVIFNLVLNARDSLKTIKPHQGRIIAVRTSRKVDICSIMVSDNGAGVADLVKERIFEPFFTTKEVGQGVGLGLTICYQLVQRAKGTLTLQPDEAGITRFAISLPSAEPP